MDHVARTSKTLKASIQLQDGLAVDYDSADEVDASKYQVLWSTVMDKGNYVKPSGYHKVEVLLLCWNPGCDDLATQEEVENLRAVFEDKFGYNATVSTLDANAQKRLQVQINAEIAMFVKLHDGPNTLFIVYYAGHGKPGKFFGDLELFGMISPNDRRDAQKRARDNIVWNKTEELLKPAEADILEIFDCCYAGTVGLTRGEDRLFEFLAAAKEQGKTAVPGNESFTSALIFALEYLLEKKEGGRFTTVELLRTIKDYAPHFPKDQHPMLNERGDMPAPAGRIMLHPLRPHAAEATKIAEMDPAKKHTVTLHFEFAEKPSESHLETLGRDLNGIFDRSTLGDRNPLPLHRVRFGGLKPSATALAVRKFQGSLHRRRASKKEERPRVEVQLTPDSSRFTSLLSPNALSPPTTGYQTQESASNTDFAASPSADSSENMETRQRSRRKRQKCSSSGDSAL